MWSCSKVLGGYAKSLQSCLTLCDPIDGSPPGSPVPGILQARTLEWVCHFLLQCMKVKSESEVAQSCLTLSDPLDCSLPGSSVHGIFQARVLEWGAIAFSDLGLGLQFGEDTANPQQSQYLLLSCFFSFGTFVVNFNTLQKNEFKLAVRSARHTWPLI